MTGSQAPRERYRQARDEADHQGALVAARMRTISHLRAGAFLLAAAPLLLMETTDRGHWAPLLMWALIATLAFLFLVVHHRALRSRERRWAIRGRMAREGEARLDRRWDWLPPPSGESPGDDHPCALDLDLAGPSSLLRLVDRTTTAPGRSLLRRWVLEPLTPDPTKAEDLVGSGAPPEDRSPAASSDDRSTPAPPGARSVAASPGAANLGDPTASAAEDFPEGPGSGTEPWPGWRKEVVRRQAAVARLAREPDFREGLELSGREIEGREAVRDTRIFLRWAASEPWLPGQGWIHRTGLVLAVLNPVAVVAWFLGALPILFPLLGASAALLLHLRVGGEAGRRLDAAEAGDGALERWSVLIRALRELPEEEEGGLLREARETLAAPGTGAADALRALRRIVDTAGVRRSSLAHFPLVALFSWDVHMLAWLERWQARHGAAVDGWVLALARAEALASMGGLAHDHPEWTFPSFTSERDRGIRAEGLGHPLLPPDRCVPNDVEVPGPGRLLLVTGSNMAGKTTLLRALGVNQVLALAGGPVAARSLETRPMLPWTAMRIRDSLTEGVSYFLAELRRIRRLVDAARAGPVLYLLDEILQGTNTAERRTAARIVLDHLLRTGSVGAVTTHDLTLADHSDLHPRLVQVHFREEVREEEGRKRLDFDYLLRPGPATSRNALLLLEIVGLGPEEAGPS